jgi:hypothetical protein
MAHSLTSNTLTKVAKGFAAEFEAARIISKTVNTTVLDGLFGADSGTTVYVKRPHQFKSISTAAGDISLSTKSDIIAGRMPATVQNYLTVAMEWSEKEETLQLDQLRNILRPAATQLVIDMETNLKTYMIGNLGLTYGTLGTLVDAWADVAGCDSLLDSLGVPGADRYYIGTPFTKQLLASAYMSVAGLPSNKVGMAWDEAQFGQKCGNTTCLSAGSMNTWTNGACADLAGALSGAPDVTYATHKDTHYQTIALKSLSAAGVITAGSVIQYTGIYYVNPKTQQPVRGVDGALIPFRQTVVTGVTLDGSGTGSISVSPPAIYEATGAYNNVTSAPTTDTVVTILGASATAYQPNLFYQKDAIMLATIKLGRMFATDVFFETADGISVRVSKYADGDKNQNKIRFDILPAFGVMNPMFGGKSFGL